MVSMDTTLVHVVVSEVCVTTHQTRVRWSTPIGLLVISWQELDLITINVKCSSLLKSKLALIELFGHPCWHEWCVFVCHLSALSVWENTSHSIDLIRETIFDYVIHFWMAKVHKRPYATVCKAVSKEASKEVTLGSFDSLRPQTWWDCREKLLNDRNGRRQLIVVLVEVSSILLL